ncbi:MAG: adenylyl cyclase, partial [Pseudomonadota bacterium]
MKSLFVELKRRNVFKVGVTYVVLSWLLIQVADTLVPILGLPDAVSKIILLLLILGFPLAVFFAWAYELTPDGIKKEEHVDPQTSITHITGRKLDFIIIAALSIALTYFVVKEYWLPPPGPEAPNAAVVTIAVLPFANTSDDGAVDYFSDGMTEEVLNVLAGVEGLRVTSRTSAFAFKNSDKDLRTIAEQLKVDHVLEGSVRKIEDRLRININLIHVATDSQLWSR